ncbi:TPA: hypothetical protein SLG40_002688 [Serratia odorifera]|nr:hypothetical protein [Serratia odorifera]
MEIRQVEGAAWCAVILHFRRLLNAPLTGLRQAGALLFTLIATRKRRTPA